MMDSGNTPFVMNVEPSGSGNGMNGWGGGMGNWDSWIWIILVFALIWGNGFGGYGNGNGMQGALTRNDLCSEFSFNDLQNAVRSGAAENNSNFRSVDNAICTLGYQNAQLVNGVQMQVANEFRGLDNAICTLGYNTQNGFNQTNISLMQGQNALQNQISECCCENRQAIAQVRYDNANNTRDIIEANNANTRAVLDYLCKDKIDTLQNENQALRLAASQEAQNQYLVNQLRPCPQPAYLTCNPFTGQTYTGYNGGCGCA